MVGTVTQQEIKQLDNAVLSVTIRAATVCSLFEDADFHDEMEFLFKKGINCIHDAMCFLPEDIDDLR